MHSLIRTRWSIAIFQAVLMCCSSSVVADDEDIYFSELPVVGGIVLFRNGWMPLNRKTASELWDLAGRGWK